MKDRWCGVLVWGRFRDAARIWRIVSGVSVASLASCSPGPTDIPAGATLVVGSVRRAGQPVLGVTIRIYGFRGACRQPTVLNPGVVTGIGGAYRYKELSPDAPGTVFCGLARAFFDHGGSVDSVSVAGFSLEVFEIGPTGAPLDSTVVDFELPPP